jgi:hypothetical protein
VRETIIAKLDRTRDRPISLCSFWPAAAKKRNA